MMMPKAKNGSDIIQPASADERALWIEGKTRAASNCAMCEVLLDFKVAEDVLTPIDCGAASKKKQLGLHLRLALPYQRLLERTIPQRVLLLLGLLHHLHR